MKKKLFTLAVSMMAFVFVSGIAVTTTYAEEETQAAVVETCDHQWQATGYRATLTKDGSSFDECTECFITKNTKVVPRIKTVKLDNTSFVYSGKARKPKLIVKDSKGKTITSSYYRVSYQKGRKTPGYYKVKVEFIKSYMGEKTLWFKINPKKAKITKASPSETKVTLNFKKTDKNISGYQVRYSTSKSFTGAKTKSTAKAKLTIKGLDKGTKYYFAVRTFKTVKKNGKKTKVYSSWSKKKVVTTKGEWESSGEAELCYEMLDLVNAERKKRGLEPFTWSKALEKGTLIRAKELATLFSHTRPNGEYCDSAFDYCGGQWQEICADDSQNEWLYGRNPEGVLEAFLASDGHRGTIIVKNYRYASIVEKDTTYYSENGDIVYKKGDIYPGCHSNYEMCCAVYEGYWIITVNISSEELFWELDPSKTK